MHRVPLLAGLVALLATVVVALPSDAARQLSSDAELITRTGDGSPSTIEVAVRLSEATPGASDVVLIGRNDLFADSLSSAFLQASGPLLLVPPEGPVPRRVAAEISRVRATRAILLGGENALAPSVVAELEALGLTVARRSGPTRLETAVAVAEADAPGATTAVLVRAFPSAGGPDSQAFADSLGVGALAATNGWPVLLTQTEVLSGSTRDYLSRSGITEVKIIGGTAAISQAVEAELATMSMTIERIAGPDRFATAIEVAKAGGFDSAADAERVVLVSGEGDEAWAGGFAAAGHAARMGGAVVLARDPSDLPPQPAGVAGAAPMPLPEATAAFLSGAGATRGAGLAPAVLTCVARAPFCEEARQNLGGAPSPIFTFTPADVPLTPGAPPTLTDGDNVAVEINLQGGVPEDFDLRVSGSCIVNRAAGSFTFDAPVDSARPDGGCDVTVQVFTPQGVTHTAIATYDCCEGPDTPAGPVLLSRTGDGGANGLVSQTEGFISADGSCAVFEAESDIDGIPNDEGGVHVYLARFVEVPSMSRQSPRLDIALIDFETDGTPAFNSSTIHGLSDDCEYALIRATGTLDPDFPDTQGLYRVPTGGGSAELVSLDQNGQPVTSAGIAAPSLSGDGQRVVFGSSDGVYHADLRRLPGGVSFVRFVDFPVDRTVAVTRSALSGDGAFVALEGLTDTGDRHIGVYEPATGDYQPADTGPTGVPLAFTGVPNRLGLSGDARYVIFDSDTTGQPGGALGGVAGIYLTQRNSVGREFLPSVLLARNLDGGSVAGAVRPGLSPNSEWLAFTRGPSAVPAGIVDAPGSQQGCGHWLHHLPTGQQRRIDDLSEGVFDSQCRAGASVSNLGSTIIITAAPLVPEDTNGGVDAYLAPALRLEDVVVPS